MRTNFALRLINNDIITVNDINTFFYVVGSCTTFESACRYTDTNHNFYVTQNFGNNNNPIRFIPNKSILEVINTDIPDPTKDYK